ncbi:S-layer homology domain-containing protein [Paenibacillus thalictri]|uniref:DUF11 domain-containing protein n=1 Tax=Paenibacillus thalictri TaxID=2527873 RepID=A0A4Q9DSH4_9BACL|nr:S-layer homology domain-containing protein [Paenibacillus thalictri]TBL77282.1 hypothetical protein EYB31_17515 [Paenibacillus thalictri]
MRRKWISGGLVVLLLLEMILGAVVASAATPSPVAPGLLSVTLDTGGEIVLGRDSKVGVTITNTSSTNWAYNVGMELVLDDGLALGVQDAKLPAYTSKTGNLVLGQETTYWKDFKNVAPGEAYSFTLTINSLGSYRVKNSGGLVEFSSELGIRMNLYGTSVPRVLYEPPSVASATASRQVTIIPFTITPSKAGKQVKGAGANSSAPASGDEYGKLDVDFEIVNNSRYPTTLSGLKHEAGGELELYEAKFGSLALTASETYDFASNKRYVSWGNITLGASETKHLTYKGAFLDKSFDMTKTTLAQADNKGADLAHDTMVKGMLIYTPTVTGLSLPAGSLEYDVFVAKDIVIYKTVTPVDVGYGTVLNYTLNVKTNEYYDVSGVTVTDKIGDGQTYNSGSASLAPVPPVAPATDYEKAAGVTTLTWNLGNFPKQTEQTITYKTTVDSNWSGGTYGTGPIYAGDSIDNEATVSGTSTESGLIVSDTENTTVTIKAPKISEAITAINGLAPVSPSTDKLGKVTIGDTVTFSVYYKSSDFVAKQHKVEVVDFLPLGTKPSVSSGGTRTTIQSDGVITDTAFMLKGKSPSYTAESNMLYWDLGDVNDNVDDVAQVTIEVQNVADADISKAAENLVNLSYQNSGSRVQSQRDSVSLNYTAPSLSVTARKVDASSSLVRVNGGQTVTIAIDVKNNSTVPAYDVKLTEYLPVELVNPVQSGNPFTAGSPDGAGVIPLEFKHENNPALVKIDPGQTVTLTYKATVLNPIGALKEIKQKSHIDYYGQPSGVIKSYTNDENAKTTMQAKDATVTKTFIEGVAFDGTTLRARAQNDLRVGDWVVYKLNVDLPTGITAYNPLLTDTLPNNESLLEVMSAYNSVTHTGTTVAANVYAYTPPAAPVAPETVWSNGKLVFGNLTVTTLPSVTTAYTYYIKAKIDRLTGTTGSQYTEVQQAAAVFDWDDASGSGKVHHTNTTAKVSVTVKTPNLTASINPNSLQLEKSDPAKPLTFTIQNNGNGVAYDFVPKVTVPEGYKLASAVKNGTAETGVIAPDGLSVTFAKRDLNAMASEQFDLTVQLIDVKGSGASFSVNGITGDYYVSDEAYQNDTRKNQDVAGDDDIRSMRYVAATANASLTVPDVSLAYKIIATSNAGDTTYILPGDKARIRPGDTVDYELKVTVPPATQAFELNVEDTIAGLISGAGKTFELVNVTFDPQASIKTYDGPDANGKLTLHLGTSPDPTVKPEGITYTNVIRVRALYSQNSPTTGEFQTNKATFGTTASAGWKPTASAANKMTASQTTSVDVVQPNLAIATNGVAQTQFSDSTGTIQVGYTLTNSWPGPAYVPSLEASIPVGLSVSNITGGGTFSGGKISWKNFKVDGSSTKSLTFDLAATSAVGAGLNNITIVPTISSYESTPTPKDTVDQKAKVYTIAAPTNVTLSTAPAALTASVTDNTYGSGNTTTVRPGDTLTYKLVVHSPGASTAFHVVLPPTGLTEQDIDGVWLGEPTGTKLPYSSADNGYVIGDVTGDTTVTVTTKIKLSGGNTPSSSPYTAMYQPSVTYLSAAADSSPKTLTVPSPMQQTVIEPNVGVGISVDKTQLTTTGDNSSFILTVNNINGHSTAYSAKMTLSVTNDVYLVNVGSGAAGEQVTKDANHITWSIDAIPVGATRQLTFRIGSHNTTNVTTSVYVQANLETYYSLPNSGGKQYGPLSTSGIDVIVKGQHILSPFGDVTLTAGKDATFDHTLTNNGAGRDLFLMSIEYGPFPADLYVEGQIDKIASGRLIGGSWVWEYIADGYNVGGVLAVQLDAGGSRALKLIVHVPQETPYNEAAPHIYKLTATGQKSGSSSFVQDKVTVTGIPLDGWSGDQLRENWKLPVYGHGDSYRASAVSAVHVAGVGAIYSNGTASPEMAMKLVNDKTYVLDGYKLWSLAQRLPDDIAAGSYEVTFVGKDANGSQLEIDTTTGPVGANNPFAVKYKIVVQGQITDAAAKTPIAGAKVTLIDPASGTSVADTTTDANGNYRFDDVTVNRYDLSATKDGYADSQKEFYALPKDGTVNTIVVDMSLSPYRVTLSADPSTILGDGNSETELTAIVSDTTGKPVAGVTVTFSSPTGKGAFPKGTTAVTDEKGEAKVPLRSDVVTGVSSQRLPVVIDVQDPVRNLYATAEIVITFDPGAIFGIVTEMVNGVSQPVAGAVVEATKDFNGDGITDFAARVVTKSDGSYLIAIPRGNETYDLKITKPVQIGGQTQYISFEQSAAAGVITEDGREKFPSTKTVSGILLGKNPDQQTTQLTKQLYAAMKGYLLDSQGSIVTKSDGTRLDFPINEFGAFSAQNINAGSYRLVIVAEVAPGQEIIVNRKADGALPELVVQQNGEMNIAMELIDPYGTVTDIGTGELIPGAHVELRYADTDRNRTNGRTPGTLVNLPELIGFAPNDNHNPQDTDVYGFYAYMVYGNTDYVVTANKPTYYTYTSPIISVEDSIVRHDIQMRRVLTGSSKPVEALSAGSGGSATAEPAPAPTGTQTDVAVDLFSDRAAYPEGGVITYTIEYVNKSAHTAPNVVAEAQIPEFTTVQDAAEGIVGNGVIRWSLGDLAANASGKIVYQVLVVDKLLQQSETIMHNEARISTSAPTINPEDDQSGLQVMLFSSRYGQQLHKRYIAGYPDGLFKADRSITRAEIAAIFARIMDLQSTVKGEKLYSDVEPSFWAGGYIEAASRAGLFGGYEDNSFMPDQAITRAELSAVIARFLKLTERPPVNVHFTDTSGHWARNMTEQIYRHHVIEGYPDGTFKPDASMIRSEAVTMINRLLYRGPLRGAEVSFPDMTPEHWAFEQVEESAITHEFTRNPDGSETLLKMIPEELW